MTLGQSLRAARAERGLTLREVSEGGGVSPGELSRIERGQRDAQGPSVNTLQAVARALGVTIVISPRGVAVEGDT